MDMGMGPRLMEKCHHDNVYSMRVEKKMIVYRRNGKGKLYIFMEKITDSYNEVIKCMDCGKSMNLGTLIIVAGW